MTTSSNILFNKRCTVVNHSDDYTLPTPNSLFKSGTWKIQQLEALKDELNEVKSRLNSYNLDKWHAHTNFRNSARDIMRRIKQDVQPEFLTKAWCKFYEIVSTYSLVPVNLIKDTNRCFKSVHLCEAPGAFVASLNHWLKINTNGIDWDWLAITLNPYYEGNNLSSMVCDDRFIRYTLNHWCFGEDYTGDLINLRNMDHLVERSKPHNDLLLITADGSVDCQDAPGDQEIIVAHLHFCEAITAMHMLAKVDVIKPITSKEGNSECYLVCRDFKGPPNEPQYMEIFRKYYDTGLTEAMFQRDDIPDSFIEKIVKCSTFFKTQQCLVITNNIKSFETGNDKKKLFALKTMQKRVADEYLKTCNLRRIISGDIIGRTLLLQTPGYLNIGKRVLQDSYDDRCQKKTLTPEETLKELFHQSENIQSEMPTSYLVTLKPNYLEEDILRICTGKIFRKTYNSRFCSTDALKLQTAIDDVIAQLGYTVEFPSNNNADQSENCIAFKYTDPYDTHEIVTLLYDKLQSITGGESISLIGFSLLTHFSVSILYIIGCMFTSIEIEMSPDLGSLIHLKHYNYNARLMMHLTNIKSVSCCAQKEQKYIVGVLPPIFLYESDIFSTIVEMNNSVIKAYIQHVKHIVEDS